MKRRTILCLTAMFAVATMSAKQISADEAIARFKAESNTPTAVKAAKSNKMVSYKTIYSPNQAPALYLYNAGETTLILPADDSALPLLGYFDAPTTDQMPEQLQWWLSEYARQIAYMQSRPENNFKAKKRTSDYEAIAPLLRTNWDQGEPYNKLCPTFDGNLGYTGCVATAGAQVLNYFKYPQKATGFIAYTDDSGAKYSMNFDEQSFDWDNMLNYYGDEYTDEQANAVAYLMKACAYAAKSNFCADQTYTWESIMMEQFINNFGYSDKAAFLFRDNYDSDTWEDIIYRNLKTVGPVIYAGDNTLYGHCFVCDGYGKDGYFHFNWGWGGLCNGYFQLSVLYSDGEDLHGAVNQCDFSLNQDAILNLTPEGNETIDLPEVFPLAWHGNITAKLTDENTVTIGHDDYEYYESAIYNCSPKYKSYDLCLKALNLSTKETTILDNVSYSFPMGIFCDKGNKDYDNIEFGYAFGLDLPEGQYAFTPVARVSGSYGEWQELQHAVFTSTWFYGIVDGDGNLTTVGNGEGDSPDIDEFELESPLFIGKPFKYSFDLTNYNDNEIMTAYCPELKAYNEDGKLVTIASGEVVTKRLKPSDDLHLFYISNMYPEEGYENYTGPVYLVLRSCVDNSINAFIATSIAQAPEEDVYLDADSFTVNLDDVANNGIRFDFTISGKAGYYLDQFVVYIENYDENTVTIVYTDEAYSLIAGDTISASVTDNARHTAGAQYTASLCYIDYDKYIWYVLDDLEFTMPETTGVADIATDKAIRVKANRAEGTISVVAPSAIASVDGYALDGRKLNLNTTINGSSADAILPNGMTLIKVTLRDGSTLVSKIIK